MKIGVFDSGIGGLAVTNAIKKAIRGAVTICVSDLAHMLYGDKTPEETVKFVLPLLEQLAADGCEAIVIACNMVTTTLMPVLRHKITVPLIGIEPMFKPAAVATSTGVVAVCATPATLANKRYAWLKDTYTKGIKVLEPDCSRWAYMIEHGQVEERLIEQQIKAVCDQGADVIVLGCTHYHWIEEVIRRVAGEQAVVMQPEQPVIARLRAVLAESQANTESI